MSKWSKKRKIWTAVAILVVILAGVYIYIATEKYAGTKSIKADFTADARTLLLEFRNDLATANKKYSDQILLVKGVVTALEEADSASVNVKMQPEGSEDYLIFAFQEQYLDEAKTLKIGDSISVKASSSGASYSEILDAYMVPFKRSTLDENYTQKPGK